MIKCHLSKLMGERKLKIADVARAIDVHRNTITLLYYEKAKRIDFEVLDKLCKFFNCKVEDILEYKKDN
ncbi:helix-turn-helix transcriptional regulator [Thermodesulfovibrio sp.]|uniref:helix-turn-helix domain-containing protein n=1 Tax=Thermodesulfovibrio sp. TaxID=2067987 RepID=UPI0030A40082